VLEQFLIYPVNLIIKADRDTSHPACSARTLGLRNALIGNDCFWFHTSPAAVVLITASIVGAQKRLDRSPGLESLDAFVEGAAIDIEGSRNGLDSAVDIGCSVCKVDD
jgi:hypothetical protein